MCMCVCVCVGGGGGGGEQQLKHQGAAPSNSVPSPDELLHSLPPITTCYHLLPLVSQKEAGLRDYYYHLLSLLPS